MWRRNMKVAKKDKNRLHTHHLNTLMTVAVEFVFEGGSATRHAELEWPHRGVIT